MWEEVCIYVFRLKRLIYSYVIYSPFVLHLENEAGCIYSEAEQERVGEEGPSEAGRNKERAGESKEVEKCKSGKVKKVEQ